MKGIQYGEDLMTIVSINVPNRLHFSSKPPRTDDDAAIGDDGLYDEMQGPSEPRIGGALSMKPENLPGPLSFKQQVKALRRLNPKPVCSCSDAERTHCKKPC